MDKYELRDHKKAPKSLAGKITWSPLKKGVLPNQYKTLGRRPRVSCSGIREVSSRHGVLFLWKDGDILTDSAFYGYFIEILPADKMRTILEFHWHPDHKGYHCVVPCNSDSDFTDRMLRNCHELNLKQSTILDPRDDKDRHVLINQFCEIVGIQLQSDHPSSQNRLWGSWG